MIIEANILQPLIDVANAVIKFLHNDVGLAWGAAIVGLTFITRALIMPLSIKQIRSMRAMSALAPQLKEIQEKYKDDRQRQQREMMRMYQENDINPFASCLPLVLQLPVFFALYQLLRSSEFKDEVNGAGWLFIDNLTAKATGASLVILVVLYLGTSLAAGLIMTGASANSQQRMITLGLPLIFTPIILNFPAGVALYWVATNIWTIGQQTVVKLFFPPPEQPTPEQVKAARPPPPPPRKRKRRR
jgi:YidC/Oxa1 family membrane protein insertase